MEWINNPKMLPLLPYFKIMRLDNMTGTFLLMWPGLVSIAFAVQENVPYHLFALFILGSIIMRSAGCIVNDIIDRKIDAQVVRTKNRPLASGDLKLHEAFLLLFLLLTIGGLILLALPSTAIILGAIIIVPIFVYPFMKRVTYWPQLFLALTINWGALMGWAAVTDQISLTAVMVYVAFMFWTLGYDTIYAHQDKEDDMLLGIKSTALKFDTYSRKYLYAFYGMATILLWSAGILTGSGILFHAFLIIAALQLYWQANTVDLNDAKDCMAKFSTNRYYGLIVFLGVMAGKVVI